MKLLLVLLHVAMKHVRCLKSEAHYMYALRGSSSEVARQQAFRKPSFESRGITDEEDTYDALSFGVEGAFGTQRIVTEAGQLDSFWNDFDSRHEDAHPFATVINNETKATMPIASIAAGGPEKCVPPEGKTCVCINENFPCYMWRESKNRCVCSSIRTEAQCSQVGGSFCKRPSTCVDNCKNCRTESSCQKCEEGYQLLNGKCKDQSSTFGNMAHLRKGNLVLLGSSELFEALSAGFQGSIQRYEAVDYALRAFLSLYKDVFDFVFIVPGEKLPGRNSNGENLHLKGDGSAESKLRSAIVLQLYGQRTTAIPLIHEIEHAWGIFRDVEQLTPGRLRMYGPHWGMSAMDRFGMLGGFPQSAVQCKDGPFLNDPSFDAESCGQPLTWDFSTGSARTSNDGIGGFSKYDLLLMGLLEPSEISEKFIFCEGASQQTGVGKSEVTCTKLHVHTSQEVDAVLSKENQISKGATLRAAVVTVMPSVEAVENHKASEAFEAQSDLAWLNDYIGSTPDRFHAYTLGHAHLDFTVRDADLHYAERVEAAAEDALAESKDALASAEDVACPSSCQAPSCLAGQSENGGQGLSSGKCFSYCSQKYGGKRYCGGSGAYTSGSYVDCRGCKALCPSACAAPICVAGDLKNGGHELSNGKCVAYCSQMYGGIRYCGSGGDYASGSYVDCTPCKS